MKDLEEKDQEFPRNKTFRIPQKEKSELRLSEFDSSSSEEDNPEIKRERTALIRSFNRGMTHILKEKGKNSKQTTLSE